MVLIAQAIAAVPVGGLLLRRGSHAGAEAAWRSASLLAISSGVAGMASAGADRLGPWHALLTVAVALSLVAAARFDLPEPALDGGAGRARLARRHVDRCRLEHRLGARRDRLRRAGLIALATLVARRRDLGAASPAI